MHSPEANNPKNGQNISAKDRRLGSKDRRRKSTQTLAKKQEKSSIDGSGKAKSAYAQEGVKIPSGYPNKTGSLSQNGDEKDFDKTQWERTRCGENYSRELMKKDRSVDFCQPPSNSAGSQKQKNSVISIGSEIPSESPGLSKLKETTTAPKEELKETTTAPKEEPKSTVTRVEEKKSVKSAVPPKISPTSAVSVTRIPLGKFQVKKACDYHPADMFIMLCAYSVQLVLVSGFLAIEGHFLYRDAPTRGGIVTASVMLLLAHILVCSIFVEIGQYVCWRKSGKRKKGRAIFRFRVVAHISKTLAACADFFLLLEMMPNHGSFKNLMYLLLIIFVSLVAELHVQFFLEKDK